jgi:lipopolysaccharide exporter
VPIKISLFQRSPFLKNLTVLVAGTVIAQAISVLALPILQRIYSPGDFGTLSLFTSLATLFAAFSTLKLEYAIILPKIESEARAIVKLSVLSVVVSFFLSFLILLFFGSKILPNVNDGERYLLMLCIPLSVLALGFYEIFNYWFNRHENYKMLGKSKIVQNTSTELYRLVHGVLLGGGGLVIGRTIGYLTAFLFMLRKYLTTPYQAKINRHELMSVLHKYRHFPLYTMPTVVISSFSNYLFIYLFIDFYGKYATGLVSVATQYITLPLGIIASSFSQVFYKRISITESKHELFTLYSNFSVRLFGISILMTVVVFLLPASLPSILFGPEWTDLMTFVRLTIIWQGIAFVSSSLSFIYSRLMKQKIMFFFALLQLTLVCLSLSFGNYFFGKPYEVFLCYVIAQGLYYCLTISIAFYFIKTTEVLKN